MEIAQYLGIAVNIGLYLLAIGLFVTIIYFVIKDVAPAIMRGTMSAKQFISLFAGGIVCLFLMSFAPYFAAKAIMFGWEKFQPVMTELTLTVLEDIQTLSTGNPVVVTVAPVPTIVLVTETPAPPTQVLPVPTVILPVVTETSVPGVTPTPFNFDEWSPDQPVPTP